MEGSRPCERPSQQRSALDLGHTHSGSITVRLRRALAGNYTIIDLVYSIVLLVSFLFHQLVVRKA